jgi:anti-anti-sigma factor
VSVQSSVQVLRLSGELDLSRREEIGRALQLDAGHGGVLVDLSDVSYADSTVIAELLRLRADAQRADRHVVLLIGSPRFARVLEYAGISQAFEVFDQRAAALVALSGGAP